MKNLEQEIVVVGSSDSVLEKSLGDRIDTFGNIFRFNRAPTKGFESFVGSKTTHRFCNNHVVINKFFEGQDMDFVPSLRDQVIISDRTTSIEGFKNSFHESCTLEIIDRISEFERLFLRVCSKPEFIDLGRNKSPEPSAGLSIISFLLNRKKKVYIYGFDVESTNPKSSPHYWWNKKSVGGYHDLGYERKFIKNLLERNYIEYLE